MYTKNTNITKTDKIIKYALVYLLIATSGISFFYGDLILLVVFHFTVILFFIKYEKKIDVFVIIFALFFLIIFISQIFKFDILPFKTLLGFFVRLFYAYFTIKIVGRFFLKYYVNILYVLTIISFIFFAPIFFFPNTEIFLTKNVAPYFENSLYASELRFYKPAPQMIIYTLNSGIRSIYQGFARNPGPFWEPSAFAGFLIIALMFNLVDKKSLKNKKSRVFLLGILTTFSTTGYIALGIILFYHLVGQRKPLYVLIALPLFLFVFYSSYYSLEFLHKKIDRKLEFVVQGNYENAPRNRFISALVDLKSIEQHPVVGMSIDYKTRFGGVVNRRMNHRNNGLTTFAVTYGLLAFIFYFYFVLKSFVKMAKFYNYRRNFIYLVITIIFVLGSTQNYFTKPIFIGFVFLHLVYYTPSLRSNLFINNSTPIKSIRYSNK